MRTPVAVFFSGAMVVAVAVVGLTSPSANVSSGYSPRLMTKSEARLVIGGQVQTKDGKKCDADLECGKQLSSCDGVQEAYCVNHIEDEGSANEACLKPSKEYTCDQGPSTKVCRTKYTCKWNKDTQKCERNAESSKHYSAESCASKVK